MSDELEQFLSSSSQAGETDSEGAFTVNLEAARAKMAKFQLADPHYFILKLVQAGVLASRGMKITLTIDGWQIDFFDWFPGITLEKIRERLLSAAFTSCETALDHLTIALNTLMTLVPKGMNLCQKIEGAHGTAVLNLDSEMQIRTSPGFWERSSLELFVPRSSNISAPTIDELVRERCGFAPISIRLNGDPVLPKLPHTSGAHRDIFFRHNKELAQGRTLGPRPAFEVQGKNVPEAEFCADLRLTVDLSSQAQIWLCKAGVLLDRKTFDLGVPGLTGVVEADHLDTDLTGVQFLLNDKAEELVKWLTPLAHKVLDSAIKATDNVDAEAAPVSLSGWLAGRDVGVGCGGGCLSGIGAFWLFLDNLISANLFSALLCLGLLFPGGYVGSRIFKKGCEKDAKSDLKAKQTLRQKLLSAKDKLRA